jgi:hypothetical protein
LLHLLFANAIDALVESELSMPEKELHVGLILGVDVMDDTPCLAGGYGFSLQW